MFAAVLLFSTQVYAAAPDTLGYQGRLTQNGVAVTGTVSVVFSLYASASGGTALWTETQPSVTVVGGLYSAILGQTTPLPSIFTQRLWIGVKVGTDAEMTPRQELTSTPYSHQAKRADSAALADSATTAANATTAVTATTANALSASARAQYGLADALRPRASTVTVVDPQPWAGLYISAAIGSDGLPIASYEFHSGSGSLSVLHCGNPACTAGNTITTVDGSVFTGVNSSLTIGTDGLPILAYYDNGNSDLKVAHCGNVGCTANNVVNTVDSGGDVGRFTSITIGADGLPIISYLDKTNSTLKVAHCGNSNCNYGNTLMTVDPVGTVDDYYGPTSIAIGADDLPVISYYDQVNNHLKVAHCGNLTCSGNPANTLTTIDPANSLGFYNSITVGADGLPIVAYAGNSGLYTAHCGNPACSAGNTVTLVDYMGSYISITIGADGLAIISHSGLRIAHCGNVACSAGNTVASADAADTGGYSAIAIGADGFPIIFHFDWINHNVRAVKCSNPWCVNRVGRR
jgi:hypothetical protein